MPDRQRSIEEPRSRFRELAEAMMEMDPNAPDDLLLTATEFCGEGRYAQAEVFAREGVRVAESQRDLRALLRLRLQLGRALLGLGRGDAALSELNTAYRLADEVPLPRVDCRIAARQLAQAYRELGQPDEASEWEERARSFFPKPDSE